MSFFNRNDTGTTMLVSPANYGGGLGGFGDSWLSILLVVLLFGGLWGGFGGMGGMGDMMWPMMMGGMGGFGGMNWLYPWLNQSQQVNDGFRDQMINGNINSIRDAVADGFSAAQLGIAGLGRDICQTGNGITAAVRDGFSAAEIAANNRQMANMQTQFGLQSAMQQGFANSAAGVADLRYTVATEACADRAAVGDALQAVTMQGVQNTNALMSTLRDGIQSIKDELCADRLANSQRETDAERRENANLRTQLSMAQLAASQAQQNALFQQGLNNEVDALYNRLKNCPVGTVPVFGNQPIFTCPTNVGNGNGCGCNGFN